MNSSPIKTRTGGVSPFKNEPGEDIFVPTGKTPGEEFDVKKVREKTESLYVNPTAAEFYSGAIQEDPQDTEKVFKGDDGYYRYQTGLGGVGQINVRTNEQGQRIDDEGNVIPQSKLYTETGQPATIRPQALESELYSQGAYSDKIGGYYILPEVGAGPGSSAFQPLYTKEEIENFNKQLEQDKYAKKRAGTISQADPNYDFSGGTDSMTTKEKVLNVLANPVEAFKRSVKGQSIIPEGGKLGTGQPITDLDENFESGLDVLMKTINPATIAEIVGDAYKAGDNATVVQEAMFALPIGRIAKTVKGTFLDTLNKSINKIKGGDVDELKRLTKKNKIIDSGNIDDIKKNADLFEKQELSDILEYYGDKNIIAGKEYYKGAVHRGTAESLKQFDNIIDDATAAVSRKGKATDAALNKMGWNAATDLKPEHVKKLGVQNNREIFEVTFPDGTSQQFWRSTGGGKKKVIYKGKEISSEGYFGTVAGHVDNKVPQDAAIKRADGIYERGTKDHADVIDALTNNKGYFIKGDNWQGYGSKTYEQTGAALKEMFDKGLIK